MIKCRKSILIMVTFIQHIYINCSSVIDIRINMKYINVYRFDNGHGTSKGQKFPMMLPAAAIFNFQRCNITKYNNHYCFYACT